MFACLIDNRPLNSNEFDGLLLCSSRLPGVLEFRL
jgi:hypothetical protein